MGKPSIFRRPARWQPFDRTAVGERIVESIRQSRSHEIDREAVSAQEEFPREADNVAIIRRARRIMKRRARRWQPGELEWLTGVQAPAGPELRLVNISRSGALVESTAKLIPGHSAEIRLCGARGAIVPVRIVRSEVAEVTSLGVTYRSALAFSLKLFLIPDDPGLLAATQVTPKTLAELLMKVTGELDGSRHGASLRSQYEAGIRQLASARDVRILTAPAAPLDGGEAVYFTIPTADNSGVILQASFEPEHAPSVEAFRLLKAAATVAGALLQFERL